MAVFEALLTQLGGNARSTGDGRVVCLALAHSMEIAEGVVNGSRAVDASLTLGVVDGVIDA